MRAGVKRLKQRIADLEEFDASSIARSGDPRITALGKSIEETLQRVYGVGTIEFGRYKGAATLHQPWGVAASHGRHAPSGELQREFLDRRANSIALLDQAVKGLEEEIAESEHAPVSAISTASPNALQRKVFIVHGHDDAALQAVARFLEKLKLEAIVLREQPDQGRTIIEKFEDYASEVGFAVVLLTPDDLAGAAAMPSQTSRARQNVIFELGYFVGKLGRGRACLLRKGEVEIPSDLYGVIYSVMDAGEGWKLKLAREFAAANLDFDGSQAWA